MSSDKFAVPASEILRQLELCQITDVVTVPDYVQISVHRSLAEGKMPDTRVIQCSTEDEVITVAAGLYIGGRRPIAIMQNQGMYASLNALRAVGLDARLPLLLLVGQFAREFSNLGHDPKTSSRALVRNTERLLDALEVPYFRLESATDAPLISKAQELCLEREGPVVVLVGAHTGWD